MSDGRGRQGTERRRYDRLIRSYRVCYRYLADLSHRSAEREGVILDISGGGLRFLSADPVDEDCPLALVVEFSGWTNEQGQWVVTGDGNDTATLEMIGVVTHQQASRSVPGRYEVGVRFCGWIG